jgi:hypothetical protein
LVELAQGLGLVWLALGLRLGLVGLAQGVWRQGFGLCRKLPKTGKFGLTSH